MTDPLTPGEVQEIREATKQAHARRWNAMTRHMQDVPRLCATVAALRAELAQAQAGVRVAEMEAESLIEQLEKHARTIAGFRDALREREGERDAGGG